MFAGLDIPVSEAALAGSALFPAAVGLGSSFTHCAGMCGPVHFFLASRQARPENVWLYHAGRITGYALLGALFGSFGHLLAGMESPVVKTLAGAALAGLYALFGLQLLGWTPRGWGLEAALAGLFPARTFGRVSAGRGGAAWLFPAGLMASLLPCPSTHAVLLFGMGMGNPALAAGAMLVLGLATLPAFAVLSRVRRAGGGLLGRHYAALLGAGFLALSAWRFYSLAGAGAPACH